MTTQTSQETDAGAEAEVVTPEAPVEQVAETPVDTGSDTPPADPDGGSGTWPEDWRVQAAGGDEKLLRRFERYASPKDALSALIQAQNKISAGLKPTPLPKDATPEQITEWRQNNGIPEDPSGYEVKLPGGVVLGEADKPVVDEFLKVAHAGNMRPDQVNSVLNWYYEQQDIAEAERARADAVYRQNAEEELRAEWGGQYRLNVNLAMGLLDSAPADVKESLLGARLADGTPLGNHPGVLRWLANTSRELNPVATVVPGAGANAASAIEDEISAIERRMAEDRVAYFKDEKAQARYRELLNARSKVK